MKQANDRAWPPVQDDLVISKFHFEGISFWTSRDDLKGLFWR
jgi:hypothetical protein